MQKNGSVAGGIAPLLFMVLAVVAPAPAALAQLSETKIIASDGADGDFFGGAVDIDRNYAVVGVRTADIGNDENAGAAYVYKKENGEWTEVQKLVASDGDDLFFFGEEVAIAGDWIIVTAPGSDERGGQGSGAAYAFQYNENTRLWEETQIIYPSDPQSFKFFGWGLAFDGTWLAIGGPRDDEVETLAGAVYVFELEDGEWEEDEKLVPTWDLSSAFGIALGLDGDRLIVGSSIDSEAAQLAGAAYIFEFIAGRWQLLDKILPPPVAPPDSLEDDTFGREVALNGDWAFVGSFDDEQCFDDDDLVNPESPNSCVSGAAFAYQRQSDDTWDFQQKIAPEELEQFDYFGSNGIAIDGDRAIVGSRGDDDACPPLQPEQNPLFCDTGAGYVLQLVDGQWQKTHKLVAADADSLDFLGGAIIGQGTPVGISGSHVIAGAPSAFFRDDISTKGKAYIFKIFNRDPTAQDDQATTGRNTPVEIGVLRNDGDPDFDKLTIRIADGPANGSVTVGDTTITYTPNVGFTGTDALTYEIDDGDGGNAHADVTITVVRMNAAPVVAQAIENQMLVAGGDAFTHDLTAVFSDADGDALTFSAGSSNDDAATATVASQTLTVDPVGLGNATITVTADDGNGGTASTTFTVDVPTAVTVDEGDAEIPSTVALAPNYPNPFNPTTRIRFAVPQSSDVRLAVYDVLGREVAVLVEARLPAGWHEAVFEADDLPSGVYVYQLEAAGRMLTRTMLLLK